MVGWTGAGVCCASIAALVGAVVYLLLWHTPEWIAHLTWRYRLTRSYVLRRRKKEGGGEEVKNNEKDTEDKSEAEKNDVDKEDSGTKSAIALMNAFDAPKIDVSYDHSESDGTAVSRLVRRALGVVASSVGNDQGRKTSEGRNNHGRRRLNFRFPVVPSLVVRVRRPREHPTPACSWWCEIDLDVVAPHVRESEFVRLVAYVCSQSAMTRREGTVRSVVLVSTREGEESEDKVEDRKGEGRKGGELGCFLRSARTHVRADHTMQQVADAHRTAIRRILREKEVRKQVEKEVEGRGEEEEGREEKEEARGEENAEIGQPLCIPHNSFCTPLFLRESIRRCDSVVERASLLWCHFVFNKWTLGRIGDGEVELEVYRGSGNHVSLSFCLDFPRPLELKCVQDGTNKWSILATPLLTLM